MARPFRASLQRYHFAAPTTGRRWASGQMFTEQECGRLSPILVPVSQRRQVIGPRIVELTTKQGAPPGG